MFTLVIAVLGMPDLFQTKSRLLSPLLLTLPLLLWADAAIFRQKWSRIRPGIIDFVLLSSFAYFIIRDIKVHTVTNAFFGISIFYLSSQLVQRRRYFTYVIMAFAGLASISSLLALLELAIFKNNLASLFGITYTDPRTVFPRIGSTLLHPVVFGAFLVMALPICGYIYFASGTRKVRIFGLVSTALCILAILFTFAKGSWLIAVLMGAVFSLLLVRNLDLMKLLFIATLAAVILLPLAILWQPVSQQTMIRIKTSVNSRTYMWRYAWRGFEQNQVFGVGQGNGASSLVNMSKVLQIYNQKQAGPSAVDNYYLDFLLEEGLAGFLPFVLFLILLFYRGSAALLKPGHQRQLLIPVFAALAAICLDALTFDALAWWSMFICFWLIAGVLYGLSTPSRENISYPIVKNAN